MNRIHKHATRAVFLAVVYVFGAPSLAGATCLIDQPLTDVLPTGLSAHVIACPQGDGETLSSKSASVTVRIVCSGCSPANGCFSTTANNEVGLTGPTVVSSACSGFERGPAILTASSSSPTSTGGDYTITGSFGHLGGPAGSPSYYPSLYAVYNTGSWFPVTEATNHPTYRCIDISVSSVDLNQDGIVQLIDLSIFSPVFLGGAPAYDPACDFDADGIVNLVDLALFQAHWQHTL